MACPGWRLLAVFCGVSVAAERFGLSFKLSESTSMRVGDGEDGELGPLRPVCDRGWATRGLSACVDWRQEAVYAQRKWSNGLVEMSCLV